MFKCKVSSNIEELNKLNKIHNWIPNEFSIRPNIEILEYKQKFYNEILLIWPSFNEYIFHEIFKSNLNNKWVFTQSLMRYNLPLYCNHYILWNIEQKISFDYDEEIITNQIKEELNKLCNSTNYDFIWYKNPKPTVLEYYHVQVFWIKLA